MQLTLVVCTYQRPLQVEQLLVALSKQSRVPDETLIVDGSCDTATENVSRAFREEAIIPRFSYYQVPPEHRGLTRQRNYGIDLACGEIIAFLDDDTIPEPNYFEEVLACFTRHPETLGVGGYITNEVEWRHVNKRRRSFLSSYRWKNWERREDYRWRLRKLLGLNSRLPPGWMPSSGHGRPVGFLPPDGLDHQVEFIMGGASAWRRDVFKCHLFSTYFEGYGLYEDLDFCIRVSRQRPLYLCTSARLAHYHAAAGRPNDFRFGEMVVRNGWIVWRRRWPLPALQDRLRWWATTVLLTMCRLCDVGRGSAPKKSLSEASGRLWGVLKLLRGRPSDVD